MCDNILGLLLVTSSSRGRNVFRYPPDPTSPLARLSQPIYPVNLFTADYIGTPDTAPKALLRNRSGLGGWDDPASSGFTYRSKKSNGSLAPPFEDERDRDKRSPSVKSPLSSLKEKSKEMQRLVQLELGNRGKDGEPSDSDSQVSEDSDEDQLDSYISIGDTRSSRTGGGPSMPTVLEASRGEEGTVTFSTNAINTRRSSSTQRRRMSRSRDRHAYEDEHSTDKFDEAQYHNSLNYSLDFLSDMLTPPRPACNRKFEICVDELVFIGHPVSCGPDGKWVFPTTEEEEADVRGPSRGRRPRSHGPSHLGTVVEHGESASPEPRRGSGPLSPEDRQETASQTRTESSDDTPPELNMFHLVIILDKPDPKTGSTIESVSPMNLFHEVYKEIAFKWTAAAYELQVRDNYIAREAHEMARIKDRCMNEGMPIRKCNKIVYDKCSLDRSLNQLYAEIYQLQNRVPNPLYANLPTTISATVADISFAITLSPQATETDEAWAHWGDVDDHSSMSSLSEDEDWNDALVHIPAGGITSKNPDFKVEPWQTLLLLDDRAAEKSEEIAQGLYGLGVMITPGSTTRQSSGLASFNASRRGSKDTSAEGDEGELIKTLIEACDISRTLANIAHVLRYDLEGIVIPLARELVQNKKAILIDPINSRLRTIVMPTSIVDHPTSWQDHSARFEHRFRDLPKLGAFLSAISQHPTHYRHCLPKDLHNQSSQKAAERSQYFEALIWLLKHDLVIQVHVRARIYARAEIKREAWMKLWHRRRKRWMDAQTRRSSASSEVSDHTKSSRSSSGGRRSSVASRPSLSHSMTSDQMTPRANKTSNPLDSLPTVPEPQQHGPMTLEQSYMDYDPELELDSDVGDGDAPQSFDDMVFSEDVTEPENIPAFTDSIICKPGRAQKDEARWLRVIREQGVSVNGERRDEVWASKFDLCVQYFDGVSTFEEVVYRTGLPRRELDHLLELYKEDASYGDVQVGYELMIQIMTVIHP